MDELHWFWQTILIFIVGKFILRLGGRKSISQITITQVIVMIGLGSLLIQPISGKGLLITFLAAMLITLLMILTEFIEMKFDFIETISTGKSVIVIENGKLNIRNIKKLRMSVDRLETRLRQSGISSIDDVKYATIEVSGQLGYELKENKKPMTKEDYSCLITEITEIRRILGSYKNIKTSSIQSKDNNIFEEIKNKNNEGKNEP
jgi:uncharacterized membrane protein YcaP (DUF421 family)